MKFNATMLVAVMLAAMGASGNEPTAMKLRKAIDNSIDWYQLFPNHDAVIPMEAVTALRWPNNIRGSTDGATVIWIANGRPEVVAAIFPWENRFIHEFDSLSRGTIVARRDDEIVWTPKTMGLEFRLIDDAPAPAATSAARLRQMKSLTNQFKATLLGWLPDNSQREELRMMSRPIYRYEIDKPDKVQDGALFAYATGTDPEVLLVIEAFGEPGAYRWEYAFVRRSSAGLEGHFRDKSVWTVGKYPQQKNPLLNHIVFARPLDEVLTNEE